MPFAVAFSAPQTFMVYAFGSITYADVQAMHDRVLAHPRSSERFHMLVDATAADMSPMEHKLREALRDTMVLVRRGLSRVAVVVASEDVRELAAGFAAMAAYEQLEVSLFGNFEDAQRWLGAQPAADGSRQVGCADRDESA
jgi:hypothetical protein